MFGSVEEFLKLWRRESGQTVRVMERLTDASLAQAIAPGQRTLGQLAWHVAGSIGGIMSQTGLKFAAPSDKRQPVPDRAAAILVGYRQAAEGLAAAVREQWTDGSLRVTDRMYGEEWPRAVTLRVLLFHEIHHRGQMTVLMRQAGLSVPGVYGPSKDEPGRA